MNLLLTRYISIVTLAVILYYLLQTFAVKCIVKMRINKGYWQLRRSGLESLLCVPTELWEMIEFDVIAV